MERIGAGDDAHEAAAAKMRNASPDEQKAMMASYRKAYDDAPDL